MHTHRFFGTLAASAVCICGFSSYAHAQPFTVFTNRAAFELALTGGFSIETFNATPLQTIPAGTTDLGLVDVTITANDGGAPAIIEPGPVNGSRGYAGDVDLDSTAFNLFTFPGPVNGAGADFTSTLTGDLLTLTVNGNTFLFRDHFTAPGNGFFGIISGTPFTSFSFGAENLTANGEGFNMDDLTFGTVLSVAAPEPGSLAMAMLPLLGIVGMGLRRRLR